MPFDSQRLDSGAACRSRRDRGLDKGQGKGPTGPILETPTPAGVPIPNRGP
jgi:hypothetical protein